MRALALVDTDSYAKWGAALLAQLPAEWSREVVVIATPALPSADQLRAALAGSGFSAYEASTLELRAAVRRVEVQRPDVVIVAMRGPAASVLLRVLSELPDRPVLVSGLPGISIPATRKALFYRGQADLVVLHSKNEIREFRFAARKRGWSHRLALATLPFIDDRPASGGTDVVFAVQSIVPLRLDDRQRVLDILVDTARRNPGHRVVIKVRAVEGEAQTHLERHDYPALLAARTSTPPNLVVASGPMSAALDTAVGLVTVSSTSIMEAIARGVPVIAISEFGVTAELINVVFAGSGMLGSGDDVAALRFAQPRPEWLDENYFHDAGQNDWLPAVDELLAARSAGALHPRRSLSGGAGGALRRAWERKRAFGSHDRSAAGFVALAVGLPPRAVVLALRAASRAVPRLSERVE